MTFYTGGSERVRIDTSGNTGFGGAAAAGTKVNALGTLPSSSTNTTAFGADGTIPSTTTNLYSGFTSGATTEATSFTLSAYQHFRAAQTAFGAGSTVTNQQGFFAASSLTGATNNYGFFGNLNAVGNSWNFYAAGSAPNYFAGNVGIGTTSTGFNAAGLPLVVGSGSGNTGMTIYSGTASGGSIHFADTVTTGADGYRGFLNYTHNTNSMQFGTDATERMRIDSSGNVGIGGTADAYSKVEVRGTLPSSSATTAGYSLNATIPSGTTSLAAIFNTFPTTQAAAFTLSDLVHFRAGAPAFGAGSTVTNQYGFLANASLTGATNNYGFFSNIASGSNRWNFYANGTADNYFAGNTGVGTLATTNVRLRSKGSDATSSNFGLAITNSGDTDLLLVRNDGALYIGLASQSPYNLTTGDSANAVVSSDGYLRRSTSSLRYKSDVTDAAHGLADVLKLRSVTYKGKNDGDKVFGGLLAEEVHDAGLTEFVAYDNEGRPDAIHYGNMVALLVKAVQELTARVAELEAK